ncbi:MAG: uracil-DNA glycosylase [Rhodoferax sp.]|jgi:uracil-DNA glycosylase|nr:uracil-DNA glycosylase [Rhodoferax sp.]
MPLSGDRLRAWEPASWPVAHDWQPVVRQFLGSAVGRSLGAFVQDRIDAAATVYPPAPFQALAETPLAQVRVVILGQDPYHGPGQAHGLAFSVPPGVRPPPSLRNIFAEVARGGGAGMPADPVASARNGNLTHWARQGALLLNTCLTVEAGLPGSHASRGWEVLTDDILTAVLAQSQPVVCMLWGAHAQAKRPLVEASRVHGERLVLCANHPSPLSARRPPVPFVGCDHFRLANTFLVGCGLAPVRWDAQAGVVN